MRSFLMALPIDKNDLTYRFPLLSKIGNNWERYS